MQRAKEGKSIDSQGSTREDKSAALQPKKTGGKRTRPSLFRRSLVRHIVLIAAAMLLCAYYILREVPSVANFATMHIAQPWHRISGKISSIVPFSVAELLCLVVVLGALIYLVYALLVIIRKPQKLQRAYTTLITFLAGALTIFALICWLWGITYYSSTFVELSGIETKEMSIEELKEVTLSFAESANATSDAVTRDENGVYVCDKQQILASASVLYASLPGELGFLQESLAGSVIQPKPLVFSYVMSHMNFTGVFFPLTGEANVNIHVPSCYLPSTVAHELAHQRGVTREQDANFAAIVACMESEEVNFSYSGALLAYTHLSNALRQASYDDWYEVYASLGENVRRDLNANNEYWAEFQTPAADASEAIYEEFLQNQGQELGMKSYGACVDLLVAYYGTRSL